MRLSDWRSVAPGKDPLSPRVTTVVVQALSVLGADEDPACWIVWGDDPDVRYTILALANAGLAVIAVRVNVPQEGPRALGKLVRWSKIQLGEVAVEVGGGHRVMSAQVEGQILRGADDQADAIGEFLDRLLAAIDGRRARTATTPREADPAAAPASAPSVVELGDGRS